MLLKLIVVIVVVDVHVAIVKIVVFQGRKIHLWLLLKNEKTERTRLSVANPGALGYGASRGHGLWQIQGSWVLPPTTSSRSLSRTFVRRPVLTVSLTSFAHKHPSRAEMTTECHRRACRSPQRFMFDKAKKIISTATDETESRSSRKTGKNSSVKPEQKCP